MFLATFYRVNDYDYARYCIMAASHCVVYCVLSVEHVQRATSSPALYQRDNKHKQRWLGRLGDDSTPQ
jgi:hypothetical protein